MNNPQCNAELFKRARTIIYIDKGGICMGFRKAQASTEYLIILAVVIVIALIVIGVMGGIPKIGSGASQRTSASVWGAADVAIMDYSVKDDSSQDDLKLVVQNKLKNTIRINSITLESTNVTMSAVQLTPGQSTEITDTDVGAVCSAGDAYSLDVSISYTDMSTNTDYTFTASGTKLEGNCAQ